MNFVEILGGSFLIGHNTNRTAMTGCTVVIAPHGATPGVSVRGGSPNTRDTDALHPENNREYAHGIVLSGGSGFGLAACDGVLQVLEEKKIGRKIGDQIIPNVSGASLFDLKIGDSKVRPDKQAGFLAAQNAFQKNSQLTSPPQGNFGAGTGGVVGAINGLENAMKGGLGYCELSQGDLKVAAVIAVNAAGDVYDEKTNQFVAGARSGKTLGISEKIFLEKAQLNDVFSGNTVIGCVITNASLNKGKTNKLADVSHNGIARAVRPAHTTYDGDTLFALCSHEISASFEAVEILAVESVRQAILNGVQHAETYGTFLASQDLEQ